MTDAQLEAAMRTIHHLRRLAAVTNDRPSALPAMLAELVACYPNARRDMAALRDLLTEALNDGTAG